MVNLTANGANPISLVRYWIQYANVMPNPEGKSMVRKETTIGNGMENMNKQKFWEALAAPSIRGCHGVRRSDIDGSERNPHWQWDGEND